MRSVISKKLKEHGFVPIDIVVRSHHVLGWSKKAADWLDLYLKNQYSQKITLEDYAKELDIDLKAFKEILYMLHVNATEQTTRSLDIEKAVEEYKEQERLNTDAKIHPLVTDKKYFNLTYFPNTIPSCFEDLDEDIV